MYSRSLEQAQQNSFTFPPCFKRFDFPPSRIQGVPLDGNFTKRDILIQCGFPLSRIPKEVINQFSQLNTTTSTNVKMLNISTIMPILLFIDKIIVSK